MPIEYTSEDDDIIREYIRQLLGTTWHSMSTCSMKKPEKGGVVDERLNVYGVEGLKVVSTFTLPGISKILLLNLDFSRVWLTCDLTDFDLP